MMFHEIRVCEVQCLSFMRKTDCIVYVGPELTAEELFKLRLVDVRVPVIYLPEVVSGITKEVFEYNFPGVPWPGEMSAEVFCDQIRAELGEYSIAPGDKVLIRLDGDGFVVFNAKGSLALAISYLINKCRGYKEKSFPMYSVALEEPCDYEEKSDVRFSAARKLRRVICSKSIAREEESADQTFGRAMDTAAAEVRDAIRNLLLKGYSAAVIRAWLDEDVKLSRLRVTKQYNILLVDYGKVVKMGPLPKTIFLFFLRHPEGVMFSHLMDYRDELLNIYSHVCKNDDPGKMHQSIDRLINPFDNSINEKCAAVKKAFMMQIEDSVARNYYITGLQGGKKGISLDRSLVEWECEL